MADSMLPPPPDGEPMDDAEPTAGGTRDAIAEALEMVTDADFLSALDDAGKLTVSIDVDSGDLTFKAGDASVSVPAHLMGSGERDSSMPPPPPDAA